MIMTISTKHTFPQEARAPQRGQEGGWGGEGAGECAQGTFHQARDKYN